MLRTLTLWIYFSAIAMALVLSDHPFIVRAGGTGLWVAGSVGILARAVGRQIRLMRARRGWVWLRDGRCSRCAYPVHWSWLVCPECGGRVGSPPEEIS